MTTSNTMISDRLSGISESATLKLNSLVNAMKAKGEKVINLTTGEPDFNPPEAAKEAVIEAVRANKSKYTPAPGIPELRELVAAKTNAQQPCFSAKPWKAANVVVTNGGKQALFNSFLAVINPGDEVIIPAPYWLSYPEMVKICGGVPVEVRAPLSQNYKIKPEQLERALGSGKVKAIVFNSPSNPTGAMYTREEFRALGEVLMRHKHGKRVWVFSDEIYDRIVLGDKPFVSFLDAVPELRDQTITFNGMSKSAAMTGWRVGWSVAGDSITQVLNTIMGQSTSGINSLAQWASCAALKLPESHFADQIARYRSRSRLTLDILQKAGTIDLFTPDGAFYAFVGVKRCLKPGEDVTQLAERILTEAKVAVVPGGPFGDPDAIRLSFATDEASLEEGCRRMVGFLT